MRKNAGRPGFRVETSDGVIDARYVVAATGPFQRPVIPAIIPDDAGLLQLHSSSYRNPRQLPDGAVLVVGAGSSGVQIADELRQSGRQVYLSVGPHDRPPRRYRGRDFVWWLGVLGKWEAATPPLGAEHVTIAVSGANGGHTVDFRALAASGITLVGRAVSLRPNGTMRFAPDLGDNIASGDANYLSLLDEADAYVARNGLDLPEEPDAHVLGPDPECVTSPVLELDLAGAGVTSVVWATGFAADYGWLDVDAFDENGRPQAPARRVVRARRLLPGPALAVAARVELHLGGLARRQVHRRPHPDPARLPRLRVRRASACPMPSSTEGEHGEHADTLTRTPASARSTPRTPTRSRTSTTTCARPSSRTASSTCAARSGRTWTPGRASASATSRRRPRRRWPTSTCCCARPAAALADIVKVVVYLTDIRYREPVYRVMGRWLKGVYPVSTGLVVAALARPEWLVEIDATAVISGAS